MLCGSCLEDEVNWELLCWVNTSWYHGGFSDIKGSPQATPESLLCCKATLWPLDWALPHWHPPLPSLERSWLFFRGLGSKVCNSGTVKLKTPQEIKPEPDMLLLLGWNQKISSGLESFVFLKASVSEIMKEHETVGFQGKNQNHPKNQTTKLDFYYCRDNKYWSVIKTSSVNKGVLRTKIPQLIYKSSSKPILL